MSNIPYKQPNTAAKTGTGYVEITFGDGTAQMYAIGGFGAGAKGAAVDTYASAHGGVVSVAEVTQHS